MTHTPRREIFYLTQQQMTDMNMGSFAEITTSDGKPILLGACLCDDCISWQEPTEEEEEMRTLSIKPDFEGGELNLSLKKSDIEMLYTEGELQVVDEQKRLLKIRVEGD